MLPACCWLLVYFQLAGLVFVLGLGTWLLLFAAVLHNLTSPHTSYVTEHDSELPVRGLHLLTVRMTGNVTILRHMDD